jgi:hypothetical protein
MNEFLAMVNGFQFPTGCDRLWSEAISPRTRSFFRACRRTFAEARDFERARVKAALHGLQPGTDRRETAFLEASHSLFAYRAERDPVNPAFFKAHLFCVLLRADRDRLGGLPAQPCPTRAALGHFFRELQSETTADLIPAPLQPHAGWLRQHPCVGPALVADLWTELSGNDLAEGQRAVHVPFAAVAGDNGYLLEWTLELIPEGLGEIYVSSPQCLVPLDPQFRSFTNLGPQLTAAAAATLERFDVRVAIRHLEAAIPAGTGTLFPDGLPADSAAATSLRTQGLHGDSATGAFLHGLACLLTDRVPDPGVIVMAAVSNTPDGGVEECRFRPVTDLGAKVRAVRAYNAEISRRAGDPTRFLDTLVFASQENAREACQHCRLDPGIDVVCLADGARHSKAGNEDRRGFRPSSCLVSADPRQNWGEIESDRSPASIAERAT